MNEKKNIIDKAKAFATEYTAEREKKRIAKDKAKAEEEERQRVEHEKQIAEYEKQIIDRAKSIANKNNISLIEALEVVKIVDSSLFNSSLKDDLKNIYREISSLSTSLYLRS